METLSLSKRKEGREMEKYFYTNEQYQDDVALLNEQLQGVENLHLVSIYRGSLGLGAHLSNVLDAPLSILKFQSYDDKNDKEVTMLHNAGISSVDKLIVLDDIYDSGNTLRKVQAYLSYNYPNTKIKYITLHGNENTDDVLCLNKHPGCWIVYPWETIKLIEEGK